MRELLTANGVKLVFVDDAWNPDAINVLSRAVPHGIPLIITTRQRRMVTAIPGIEALALPNMEPERLSS